MIRRGGIFLALAAGLAGLAGLAGPAEAELASAPTPQGVARVEGDPFAGGERLLVGDRVAFASPDVPRVWIEARRGSLLLIGLSEGGTACPALWTWLDAGDPGFRRTEEFGTCSDVATSVTSDSETVTVTMPSADPEHPRSAFVWDGKGPVREVALGQEPSGAPPAGDPRLWAGRYPHELLAASDWRGAFIGLMGEDGYRLAQRMIQISSPMRVDGGWVVGSGSEGSGLGLGAVAISLDDGRLLVAVKGHLAAPAQVWGDPRGTLPLDLALLTEGG